MTTITMDPNELDDAAGALRGIFASLSGAAGQLDSVGVAVEMPGALAARVTLEVSAIATSLRRAADSLEGLDGELGRRAQLGRIADASGHLYGAGIGASLPAGIIADAYARGGAAAVGTRAGELATKANKGFTYGAGGVAAAGVALKTFNDVRNPYLDNSQRAANLAARAAVEGGKVWAGTAVAAAAVTFGAPVGVPVLAAVAVGIGLTVLDEKLGVTKFVADKADDVIDAGADLVSDVGSGLGKIADGIF